MRQENLRIRVQIEEGAKRCPTQQGRPGCPTQVPLGLKATLLATSRVVSHITMGHPTPSVLSVEVQSINLLILR